MTMTRTIQGLLDRLARPRFSLVGRYTLLSLSLILASLLFLGVLYDRFAETLMDRLTGERLQAQMAATGSRLGAFFDNRSYQLETLSTHPALSVYLQEPHSLAADKLEGLLRIEADVPDLYGILFLDAADRLTHVVAGQAASGPPYWDRRNWRVDHLPRVSNGSMELIGPALPESSRPGWLLMRQPIRGAAPDGTETVALHVRLASITELLGAEAVPGVVRPLLRVPGGALLDATGRPVNEPAELIRGPEVLPGWVVEYAVQPEPLLGPLQQTRIGIYALALATGIGIMIVFGRLAYTLRRRVNHLVEGADALAAGDLQYRLGSADRKGDEIDTVAQAFNAMAARLRGMIDRTVQVEKMAVLGEFATGVAHEVRNPLATMKVTVQALERREADAERRELLQSVASEIDRLNRVVGDLLAYGRPHPAEPGTVPMRSLFRRALALTSSQAAEQSVSVSTQGDSRLAVHADPDQVLQALVNLVANGIQACEPGGNVRLRAQREGHTIRIEISDDGRGIPSGLIARVTDPFFTTRPRGTGLGLSISRQLIGLNQGRLSLQSVEGQGTTVTLRLPTAQDLSASIPEPSNTVDETSRL
ncbi:MAG: HAMP domain-containing protein [Ectothiorhodospiraceae bacterium]|nr:HAMP domain-containing protein [Ectothiorhodospiraceae bacterium]